METTEDGLRMRERRRRENGTIAKETYYSLSGVLEYVVYYNSNGNENRREIYDSNGICWDITEYYYDEDGNDPAIIVGYGPCGRLKYFKKRGQPPAITHFEHVKPVRKPGSDPHIQQLNDRKPKE